MARTAKAFTATTSGTLLTYPSATSSSDFNYGLVASDYRTVQKRHGTIKKLVKGLHSDTPDNGQRAPEPPATVSDTAPSAADLERRARIEQARQSHCGSGWTMKAITEEMGRHPKTIGRYLDG